MKQSPAAYALAAGAIVLCIIAVARDARDDVCAPARRAPSGSCCAPWQYASEQDGCLLRPWNLPAEGEALGSDVAALSAAVMSDGRIVFAWQEVTGPMRTDTAVASELGSGGFWRIEPARALSGRAEQCGVASGPDGALAVAWRQVDDERSGIMAATRRSDESWSLPAGETPALSPPAAYLPSVAYVGSEPVVAWGQQGSRRVRAAVAHPDGSHELLSPPLFFANDVMVAGNARGDGLVTWYQSAGAALQVFASERRDGGGWSHPRADQHLSPRDVGPEGTRGRYLGDARPALAEDGAAAVVWAQPDAGNTRLMLATRTPEGVWNKPRDASDTFSVGDGDVSHPAIAFTPSGDLYLTWRHVHGSDQAIYLAHRLADGRWLASGATPVRLSAMGAEVIEPVMAAGSDGGVVVAWSQRRGNEPWAVMVRRSSSHAAGWEAQRWSPELRLSPPGGDALGLVAAMGGSSDRTVVAWIQQAGILYATVD